MRLSLNISAELSGVEHWNLLSGYMTHHYSAPQNPPRTFPPTRLLGPALSRRIFPALKRLVLKHYAANFRRMRRRLGLAPVGDLFAVMTSPHRNLIADLPEYTPCDNLPGHFEFVGPLIWEPDIPDPAWLDQLDPNKPTVYVTMGSTGNPDSLRRVLETLRDHGWQVLATMGRHGRAPSGIHAVEFGRASSLLRRSQVTLCHGGSGTIYQSISEGVPVVGIPTFHDQETNMDRVEALGWGRGLDPLAWRGEALLEAMQTVRAPAVLDSVARGRRRLLSFIGESDRRRWVTDWPAKPAPAARHHEIPVTGVPSYDWLRAGVLDARLG